MSLGLVCIALIKLVWFKKEFDCLWRPELGVWRLEVLTCLVLIPWWLFI